MSVGEIASSTQPGDLGVNGNYPPAITRYRSHLHPKMTSTLCLFLNTVTGSNYRGGGLPSLTSQ